MEDEIELSEFVLLAQLDDNAADHDDSDFMMNKICPFFFKQIRLQVTLENCKICSQLKSYSKNLHYNWLVNNLV